GTPRGGLAFAPTVDGEILLAAPRNAVRQGVGSEVPLLIGSTRDEFAFPVVDELSDAATELAARGVDSARVEWFRRSVGRIGTQYTRSALLAISMFRAPLADVVASRVRTGAGGRTWVYDYAYPSEVTGTAAHCHEVPFVFDLLDGEGVTQVLGANPPQKLADAIHQSWVRFIASGDAEWPDADAAPTGARTFGATAEDLVTEDPNAYALETELLRLGPS
ncbi:MAG: carboxylesterase family protein, partial [Gordonia sp. (in: high G+C Gram-positive bacteria)]